MSGTISAERSEKGVMDGKGIRDILDVYSERLWLPRLADRWPSHQIFLEPPHRPFFNKGNGETGSECTLIWLLLWEVDSDSGFCRAKCLLVTEVGPTELRLSSRFGDI